LIVAKLPLRGAGGEPISFARTVYSHGCAELAPATIETEPLRYRRTLRIDGRIVEIVLTERDACVIVESDGRIGRRAATEIERIVARMFRLDDDLSGFYAAIAGDERLQWAAAGAGRMLASPTIFEDVVKTICTTNCSWSATIRMTRALAELGGGAFPEPAVLARTPSRWYTGVAKMGYRGPYIKQIASDVAAGKLDLEALGARDLLSDDEVEAALLALPGIGPYAAAHVMQIIGRHRRLVLDSWTRPTYVRLAQRRRASDTTIQRAFARYGDYAGLAFWLFLTRSWVTEARPTKLS
jgi:3-methyladenine DNA glycosylase/8-oxoguanine DNA glycosylase